MVQSEFQQEIDSFKKDILDMVQTHYTRTPMGEIAPTLFVLIKQVKSNKIISTANTLPPILFANDKGKDVLAKVLVPALLSSFENSGQVPIAICLVMEMWYRHAPVDESMLEKDENGKVKLPVKIPYTRAEIAPIPPQEGVMLNFETQWNMEQKVYLLKRSLHGTVMDDISSGPGNTPDFATGRFVGLFKKSASSN